MGLRGTENEITLAGDTTPLTGDVAVLGKRELEIISRAPPPPSEQIFVRVRILVRDCIHIPTAFPVYVVMLYRISINDANVCICRTRQMEIRDVLQAVCRITKLEASQCILKLADGVDPLAMDATVDDLGGERFNLILTDRDPLAMNEGPPLPISLRISLNETYLSSLSV